MLGILNGTKSATPATALIVSETSACVPDAPEKHTTKIAYSALADSKILQIEVRASCCPSTWTVHSALDNLLHRSGQTNVACDIPDSPGRCNRFSSGHGSRTGGRKQSLGALCQSLVHIVVDRVFVDAHIENSIRVVEDLGGLNCHACVKDAARDGLVHGHLIGLLGDAVAFVYPRGLAQTRRRAGGDSTGQKHGNGEEEVHVRGVDDKIEWWLVGVSPL